MSKIAKNSVLYLASTLAVKATSFILLPFYSYLLTPDVYGEVFVVNTLIAFVSLIMPWALNSSLYRFYFNCQDKNDEVRLYSTVIWTIAISIIVVSISIIATLDFWTEILGIPQYYVIISMVTSSFLALYTTLTSFLYAKQQATLISVITIVVGVMQISFQLYLVITLENKALALIYSYLINAVILFLIFVFFSKDYLRFVYSFRHLRELFVYALSQLPSDLSVKVVSLFDRFVLNKYVNAAAVGIYGIGYTLGTIPSIIFVSINQALAPSVYIDFKTNTDNSYKQATERIEIVFILITCLFTSIIVFSNSIVSILSSSYIKSGSIMALVLIALLIDTYRILFMYPMAYVVRFVKIKSFIWILSAIISISLNFILIPKLSIYGAAYSFLTANSITLLLIFYYSNKAIPLPYNYKKLTLLFIISLLTFGGYYFNDSLSGNILKILIILSYYMVLFWFLSEYRTFKLYIKKFKRILYVKFLYLFCSK